MEDIKNRDRVLCVLGIILGIGLWVILLTPDPNITIPLNDPVTVNMSMVRVFYLGNTKDDYIQYTGMVGGSFSFMVRLESTDGENSYNFYLLPGQRHIIKDGTKFFNIELLEGYPSWVSVIIIGVK